MCADPLFDGVIDDEARIRLRMLAGGCRHTQAEPVILSRGERVACVCVTCYDVLPEGWIVNQRVRAEREAYCEHSERLDVTPFGQFGRECICADCGRLEVE